MLKAAPSLLTLPALALAASALALAPARAEDSLSTDRPDFVESSDVLPAGRAQIETGLSMERSRDGTQRSRTLSTPTLLRFGLGHGLEARLETDGFVRSRETDRSSSAPNATTSTTTSRGAADLSLGLKWHVTDGDEGRASTAWLFHVDLDSGSAAFRGEGIRPSVRFVAEWDLPEGWSVGVMPGLARDTGAQGRHIVSGILAATASHDIAQGLRGYVEVAGQRLASKKNGGNIVSFDTGLTQALGPDMQLDVSLQRGLTRTSPDWTFGIGLSARF